MKSKNFEIWLGYLLIISAFLGPAVSYQKIYLLHLVILFLYIYQLRMMIKFQNKKKQFYNILKKNKFFIFFQIWIVTSILWSADLKSALIYNLQVFTGISLVIFIQVYALNFKRTSKIMICLIIIHFIVSILEIYTSFRLPVSPFSHLLTYFKNIDINSYSDLNLNLKDVPTSFFWHPNNGSLVTFCISPFALSYLKNIYLKVLYFALALLLVTYSGSKSIFLFLTFYGVIYFLYLLTNAQFRMKIFFFIISSSLLLFLFLNQFLGNSKKVEIKNSFHTTYLYIYNVVKVLKNNEFEIEKSSVSERIFFIKEALYIYKKSKIFGIGAGQLYNKYSYFDSNKKELSSIHNYWLEILVLGGPILFIFYLYWFFSTLTYFLMSKKALGRSIAISMFFFFCSVPVMSSAIYFMPKWLFYGLIQRFKS